MTAALLVALAVVAHAGPPAPAPGVPRGRQSGAPAAAGATALAPRGVVEGIAAALARDDVAGAKAAADPAIAAYPADPVLHNLAGVIEVRRGASSVAEAHFETAIRLQPRSPAPYINLGRLLQERAATDPAARPAARSVYARLLAVDARQSTDALDAEGTRLKQHQAAVKAASKAGVGHIVYTSLPNAESSLVTFAPDSPVTISTTFACRYAVTFRASAIPSRYTRPNIVGGLS